MKISPTLSERRYTNAFTLIEVLIVVVILGLLIAVGVQRMGVARARGQAVAARTMVQELNKNIQRAILDDVALPASAGNVNAAGGDAGVAAAIALSAPYSDEATVKSWTKLVADAVNWNPQIKFGSFGAGGNFHIETDAANDKDIKDSSINK